MLRKSRGFSSDYYVITFFQMFFFLFIISIQISVAKNRFYFQRVIGIFQYKKQPRKVAASMVASRTNFIGMNLYGIIYLKNHKELFIYLDVDPAIPISWYAYSLDPSETFRKGI